VFVGSAEAVGVRLSAESQVAIPVIVLGEFRDGISGSRYRDKYERWLADHLSAFEILSVTESTTVAFARVRASLKKLGRPIPANDTWIAALALQHRLPVLSRDEHFDAYQAYDGKRGRRKRDPDRAALT
jgi:tRNA(fMet)-specific endonuclease VapC